MTAKEIVDFVVGWLEAGQAKRTQTFSEVALTGQFGTESHYNQDDVENLYQRLVKLDEMDSVLVIKCILEKLNFADPSILDSVMSSHNSHFDKTVIKILSQYQPLSPPTPVLLGRIRRSKKNPPVDNPMRSIFDQRWAEVQAASTVS